MMEIDSAAARVKICRLDACLNFPPANRKSIGSIKARIYTGDVVILLRFLLEKNTHVYAFVLI